MASQRTTPKKSAAAPAKAAARRAAPSAPVAVEKGRHEGDIDAVAKVSPYGLREYVVPSAADRRAAKAAPTRPVAPSPAAPAVAPAPTTPDEG